MFGVCLLSISPGSRLTPNVQQRLQSSTDNGLETSLKPDAKSWLTVSVKLQLCLGHQLCSVPGAQLGEQCVSKARAMA